MSNTTTTPAPSTSLPASTPTSNTPSAQPSSLTSPSSSATPATSQPASTPVTLPSSTQAQSSVQASSSNTPAASSNNPQSTITASTPPPTTVETLTSVSTVSPTAAGQSPSTILVTLTQSTNGQATNGAQSSANPTDTSAPGLQNPKGEKAAGGLTTGGKTAIAVVVPVVVVALLVIAGILLWRRRKAKKNDEDARRKEVEEYGFNPNDDPTLPAVGMQSEMAEDQSGYRGWGNTTTSSNRKASTTLASGMTYSDSNSNPGGYQSPGSPTDNHSGDGLMNNRRETLDSDGIGALGAAPTANQNQGVHRGPSNASSSYSAAERSDNSGDYPLPAANYNDNNQGYYHASPYDPNGYGAPPQPIIRDVSARRNTRIESPSVFPQQGNSGIAQNF